MNNQAVIGDFLGGLEKICGSIDRQKISNLVDGLYDIWKGNKTLFLIGNGGSASTASHFACDLNKCTIVPAKQRMKVLALVDNIPLVSALTNDDGWENVYLEQLKNFYRPGDGILAISVHGGTGKDKAGQWSQNLLKAMQFVRDADGPVYGFSGFDGGAFESVCHTNVIVPFNTTPHVEAFHVALHHMVTSCLYEKIKNT